MCKRAATRNPKNHQTRPLGSPGLLESSLGWFSGRLVLGLYRGLLYKYASETRKHRYIHTIYHICNNVISAWQSGFEEASWEVTAGVAGARADLSDIQFLRFCPHGARISDALEFRASCISRVHATPWPTWSLATNQPARYSRCTSPPALPFQGGSRRLYVALGVMRREVVHVRYCTT